MTQTSTRRGYGTVCVVLLSYFLPVYVFEVGELNDDTFRILPPPVDLENPVWTGNTGTSRLPIFFPWWNFSISPIFMFSRSRNSMMTRSEFYHHRLTTKIQFEPEIMELRGYPSFSLVEFWDITYIYVFEVKEFNDDTFRILPPPVDLKNPVWTRNTGSLRLPIFFPGGILGYHLYLCFRGQGIQWWHVQNSTATGWPRKSSLNRKYWNFEVTHLFPWWNFRISPIFMFLRSRNSMVTRSEFYHHRLTLKIQVQPEILELWRYPSFSLMEFYEITYIYVFEVEEFNCDTFRILKPLVDLKNQVREIWATLKFQYFRFEPDFRNHAIMIWMWKCVHWIPRPQKHKYR